MKTFSKILIAIPLLLLSLSVQATTYEYNIGGNQWIANTYTSEVTGLSVTGTADKALTNANLPDAVFSGNDNPVVPRNFTYHLPVKPANAASCTASIEFFHLTLAGVNPEGVGNFNPTPDSMQLGATHSFNNNTLEGSLSHFEGWENISTLSWELGDNLLDLSFDISSNGNISYSGHKNLIINCIDAQPATVPTLNQWAIFLLSGILLITGLQYRSTKTSLSPK